MSPRDEKVTFCCSFRDSDSASDGVAFSCSGAGSWGLAQKTTEYNSCADEVNKSLGLCSHLYVSCV